MDFAMLVSTVTCWVQKAGSRIDEYEDASWPSKPLNNSQGFSFRFAVADGATESSYAKIWAKQLVRSFCIGKLDAHNICEYLPSLQRRWSMIVNKRVTAQGRALPWYVWEKVRVGAFAAILGVSIDEDLPGYSCGNWRAIAVGDSCVVHMRGGQVLTRFPLDNSASFSSHPKLLSSNPDHNESALDHLHIIEGTWKSEDTFYLMTDALACWFMKAIELGQTPWTVLRSLEPNPQIEFFRDWVDELRASKAMRNDDVTLLRVNIIS
jgi:hypothetical protein